VLKNGCKTAKVQGNASCLELGKWLSDDGEKLYGTFAEFRRVIAKHDEHVSCLRNDFFQHTHG